MFKLLNKLVKKEQQLKYPGDLHNLPKPLHYPPAIPKIEAFLQLLL